MFERLRTVGALGASVAALLLAAAASYAADNAVITGDGVSMRDGPSTTRAIVEILAKGTRVLAVSQTNFVETIGTDTAVWYEVRHGDLSGYVFGRYVGLDAGVSVPTDESGYGFSDPIFRFTDRGVRLFGKTEAGVVAKLGRPLSRTEKPGDYPGDIIHTLTYDGVVVLIYRYAAGGAGVYQVSVTTDAYAFDGLKVGSSLADVERLLGTNHRTEGDTVTYGDNTGYLRTSFGMKDGKVVEITFFSDYYD